MCDQSDRSYLSLLVHDLPLDDDERDEAVMATKLVDQVLPPAGTVVEGATQSLHSQETSAHPLISTMSHTSGAHLGALTRTMLPYLPTSSEPCLSALPIAAAALSVAATSASSIVRRRRTHARCITIG